ncbi:hypothetical protein HMPREF9406_3942 [Clostridium sp. HGF2]|nr:hypothetical protein HMPREF9406_3942 [Clostridium sp. HGF2]
MDTNYKNTSNYFSLFNYKHTIKNCFVFSRKRYMDGNGYFINHVNSIGKLCFFMAKIVKES